MGPATVVSTKERSLSTTTMRPAEKASAEVKERTDGEGDFSCELHREGGAWSNEATAEELNSADDVSILAFELDERNEGSVDNEVAEVENDEEDLEALDLACPVPEDERHDGRDGRVENVVEAHVPGSDAVVLEDLLHDGLESVEAADLEASGERDEDEGRHLDDPHERRPERVPVDLSGGRGRPARVLPEEEQSQQARHRTPDRFVEEEVVDFAAVLGVLVQRNCVLIDKDDRNVAPDCREDREGEDHDGGGDGTLRGREGLRSWGRTSGLRFGKGR